jgi:predicted Zn-dependent protease
MQCDVHRRGRAAVVAVSLALAGVLVSAETVIRPPANRYTPAQDVELGRRAAAEARRQFPILNDRQVTTYVASLGRRLTAAVPGALRHRGFRYSFEVVNAREINAFALPGGPMFVNRGMIEAAQNEGQVAGVMAHELSHIVLRHGTAQASRATKYEIGEMAGAIAGAIIGGRVGSAVAQGTRFGLGTAFMRFSREFERQADLEGAQIMARAGYDPRDMAGMFRIIAARGGAGGPEWLSDHPNPGNRSEYIVREARMLKVKSGGRETGAFRETQIRLRRLPPPPSRQVTRR